MNEADFAALSEHLVEVRPLFDDCCVRHGFEYVSQSALGRYPRVRIERPGVPKLWFDLWMEWNKEGKRFERFSRDLPYELSAGAYSVEQDGSAHGVRFQMSFRCFSGKPFDQVAAALLPEMEKQLQLLETWNVNFLKQSGTKVQLGAAGKSSKL